MNPSDVAFAHLVLILYALVWSIWGVVTWEGLVDTPKPWWAGMVLFVVGGPACWIIVLMRLRRKTLHCCSPKA